MKSVSTAIALACTLTMGCVATENLPDETESKSPWVLEPIQDSPDKPVTTPESEFLACDAQLKWVAQDYRWWLDPAEFAFSPNDGLLLRADEMQGMGIMFSAHDGEIMSPSVGRTDGFDGSWDRAVRFENHGPLEIVSTVSGRVLSRFENPLELHYWAGAALRQDGMAAAAVSCTYDEEGSTKLHLFGPDLQLTDTIEIAASNCIQYGNGPDVMFDEAGRVVIGLALQGTINVYDETTGELRSKSVHTPSDNEWGNREALLTTELIPGTNRVITTGLDGRLVITDLDDLTEVDAWEVGHAMVNEMTYAPPHAVSPVAVSPDGKLIAFVDKDLQVIVTDGSESISLELPEVEVEWEADRTYAPALLAFSNSGNELAVGTEYGAAMFGCDVERQRNEGVLTIILEGPETATAGESLTFVATHVGHIEFHAHRFMVNGEFMGHAAGEREFNWYVQQPGEYEIIVEVDDGVSTGFAQTQVTVFPQEGQ